MENSTTANHYGTIIPEKSRIPEEYARFLEDSISQSKSLRQQPTLLDRYMYVGKGQSTHTLPPCLLNSRQWEMVKDEIGRKAVLELLAPSSVLEFGSLELHSDFTVGR